MAIADLTLSRRQLLRASLAAGGLSLCGPLASVLAQAPLRRTPEQVLGPFYPVLKSIERGTDLTMVPGRPGRAQGQVVHLMGRVLNQRGEPVPGVRVEIWQANTHGRYTHPRDANPAPLGPELRGLRGPVDRQRGAVPVQDDQARGLSHRHRELDASAAHPLRRLRACGSRGDADVLRGRAAEREGPLPSAHGLQGMSHDQARGAAEGARAGLARGRLGYRPRVVAAPAVMGGRSTGDEHDGECDARLHNESPFTATNRRIDRSSCKIRRRP